jgi:hypothetical protein
MSRDSHIHRLPWFLAELWKVSNRGVNHPHLNWLRQGGTAAKALLENRYKFYGNGLVKAEGMVAPGYHPTA